MNARANYVAVGAFVLVVLAGIFISFLWLARVQFQTGYTSYATHVAGPVTGLNTGALVRLNGIEVGRVTSIDLDPDDPEGVVLILRVRQGVEIRRDAVASLETQGLTGVEYVEISGGTRQAPPLVAAVGERYPTIASRPSSLQRILSTAPGMLSQLSALSSRFSSLLDTRNQAALNEILDNTRETTAVFAHHTKDIDRLIVDGGETLHNLAASSALLQTTLEKLDRTSDRADQLAVAAQGALDRATKLAIDLDAIAATSRPGLRDLTTNDTAQLGELLEQSRRLLGSLNRVSAALERDPGRFLFGDHNAGYRPQ
jgi:phospholipid/cholesterol/gamma-HCH transport system substrate-binding protein